MRSVGSYWNPRIKRAATPVIGVITRRIRGSQALSGDGSKSGRIFSIVSGVGRGDERHSLPLDFTMYLVETRFGVFYIQHEQ